MDILSIITEAKKPSETKTIAVKMPGPQDDYSEDTGATDYSDVEEEAPTETDDETTTDNEPDDEDEGADYDEEDETVDYTDGADGDEPSDDGSTDYTDDSVANDSGDGEPTDDATSDAPVDGPDTNQSDTLKQSALCDNFITFHGNVKDIITRLSAVDRSNFKVSLLVRQVSTNLEKLQRYLFVYITERFQTRTYVENLYMFNYLLEAYKINARLLDKLNGFSRN